MLRKLEDQYLHEDADLAPYAIHNLQTRGRKYPEEEHPLRTNFQRDRDRVLHSRAFRRLEYKTQVFLNGTGDHLRTRLTHTIEVGAICRTIARALHLNEDLSETIALAHDLGHSPFGHPGERVLNELMVDDGGFDHNQQSLRIIDFLEIKYPEYDGINLSWEVRSGLIKHRGPNTDLDGVQLPSQPSLESQIADLGDDLTYYGHDVDDGLEAGLITEEMLREISIWRLAAERAREHGLEKVDERFQAYCVRCLIDMMVVNATRTSNDQIEEFSLESSDGAQQLSEHVISFDPDFVKMTQELRDFLYHNVYFHPKVMSANDAAVDRMRQLFETYVARPELMGRSAKRRIKSDGLRRTVCDYIAGMTDRFAMIEFERCCK